MGRRPISLFLPSSPCWAGRRPRLPPLGVTDRWGPPVGPVSHLPPISLAPPPPKPPPRPRLRLSRATSATSARAPSRPRLFPSPSRSRPRPRWPGFEKRIPPLSPPHSPTSAGESRRSRPRPAPPRRPRPRVRRVVRAHFPLSPARARARDGRDSKIESRLSLLPTPPRRPAIPASPGHVRSSLPLFKLRRRSLSLFPHSALLI